MKKLILNLLLLTFFSLFYVEVNAATFIVTSNHTGDSFGTALLNSGIATRQGTGNSFRVTDNIEIRSTVELHGYTLQFINGKGIYTNTSNGYIKAGYEENGNIIKPLNLIFEGISFSSVNNSTDGNSWIRGGSRWETYGLNITYQKITNHTDTVLSDNIKTHISIFKYLSLDVLEPSFDNYLDINLKSGSIISILKLRNSNIRLQGEVSPIFIENGFSWLRGQSGQNNLKLLSDVQTISKFIPAYPNLTSGVETTSSSFSANTLKFLDSKIDGENLLAFPPNNTSVNRYIQRTFKFLPIDLATKNPINDFNLRITSNRVVFGDYPGSNGNIVLYDLYDKNTNFEQIVDVYHATNHNTSGVGGGGAYKNATTYRVDKDISIKWRKAGYQEYIATTNTYQDAYNFNPAISPDLSYNNTSSTITNISNAKELYDISMQYLEANLGIDITISRNDKTIITNHNVIFDSNSSSLISFSGNNLTVKSSIFSDNIVTTGIVSIANGAILTGKIQDSTANSGVKIYTPYNNQIVRVYGSISDMNSNTNSLGTYTSDINGELIYRYNSNINTKRYFKTELSSSIGKGSMKSYVLNPGLDNELDMRTGGDFTYINLQLRQIKGSGFDSNLHSLKSQYSTGGLVLNNADKLSIAEYVKTKMEEPSSLLSKIYSLLQEIFTRIISIKYDTQKIN